MTQTTNNPKLFPHLRKEKKTKAVKYVSRVRFWAMNTNLEKNPEKRSIRICHVSKFLFLKLSCL